ncbi:OmpA family protein [Chitinophaga sancti]|uniref:OmpA family protein n=1 Tax=Chitinophaga sancti TaxID=1004 RepID=A0A1K1SKB7_9BACT|nr:OmpA family protein [Chitinophaga sancti]WQD65501.1 OmpA family protein [Chitinophaga sancti]WQG88876.1 OmpA family protein [Chitinophaga sancti]SFW84738.1 Outer membrane protein OmpA [Chitinophaga sancti]
MLRKLILFICPLFIPLFLYGQEDKSLIELGDEAFARQEYAEAAKLYSELGDKRKAPLPILEKTARCYIEIGRFDLAASWYYKMLQSPACPSIINVLFGITQMNIEQYDTAKKYIALYNTSNADSTQWKSRLLAGCDSAMLWKQATQTMALENIKELSTPGADWISGVVRDGLLLVSNGYRKMALTTGSERNPDIDPRVDQPYFKPYVFKQYQKGSNANTYLEEVLPKLLGKLPYHVGPVCFNAREDTAYITLNSDVFNKTRKGPINGQRLMSLYWSFKQGDSWGPIAPITTLNMAGSYSGNVVLSGRILYLVSDRPGGVGKTDIWYSERQSDGSWGTPKNCGAVINTPFEETFPTINEKGALYFSSKGHTGIGGYDIFRAAGSGDKWVPPVNLKSPVNSGADDLGFIMKDNNYEGYFASNRNGGSGGDDVYHFMETHFTEKIENKPTTPVVVVSTPPPAPTQAPIPPPPGNKKKLSSEDSAVIDKLEHLCFYYDYNSAILLTSSREMLDRVATVLRDYPQWKLMVRSYTDSRGTDQYNVDLSALRCYAVIDYLIKKGVPAKNLYYENMGEKELVNPCADGVPCNEDEHRKNRRSMLKIFY